MKGWAFRDGFCTPRFVSEIIGKKGKGAIGLGPIKGEQGSPKERERLHLVYRGQGKVLVTNH